MHELPRCGDDVRICVDQGGDQWEPLSNRSAQSLCVLALVLTTQTCSWTFERHPIPETEQLKTSKTNRENEQIPQKIPGKIPKGQRESYSVLPAAVSNAG